MKKKQTVGDSKEYKSVSQVSHSSLGAANQVLWFGNWLLRWQETSMAILLYQAAGMPTAGRITLGAVRKGKAVPEASAVLWDPS